MTVSSDVAAVPLANVQADAASPPRQMFRLAAWGFLSPYLLLFALFWLYPIADSAWLTLHDTRQQPGVLAPLANWERLLADPMLWTALRNTLLIIAVQVPLMILLATLLAVALASPRLRWRGLHRFALFAPVVVGEVAYAALFRLMFNDQFGAVNGWLAALGVAPLPWLNSPAGATAVIAIALTWRWTGYNAIMLLAGVQQIPAELYEAARLDGASPLQQFWHITLPRLKNVLLFCMVLSLIGTLQLYTEPALITGAGPGDATLTLAVYLYRQGFHAFDFGYAATVAWLIVALAVLGAVLQFKLVGKED